MAGPSALQKRREKRTIFGPQTFIIAGNATSVTNAIEKSDVDDDNDDNCGNNDGVIIDNNENENHDTNNNDQIVMGEHKCEHEHKFEHECESLSSPCHCHSFSIDASLHNLPRTLYNEIELVFPDIASQVKHDKKMMTLMKNNNRGNNNGSSSGRSSNREYLVIPTYHQANFSILEINDKSEKERLRIFLRFKDFATQFYTVLKQKDPQALLDIPDIDGSATNGTPTMTIYDEVASTRSILGYSTFFYMGIQIVHHPQIGYAKLAILSIIIYANIDNVKQTFMELLKVK